MDILAWVVVVTILFEQFREEKKNFRIKKNNHRKIESGKNNHRIRKKTIIESGKINRRIRKKQSENKEKRCKNCPHKAKLLLYRPPAKSQNIALIIPRYNI